MGPKLELQASFTLYGVVQSIQATRLTGGVRDTLFLTFMDAKLSGGYPCDGALFSNVCSVDAVAVLHCSHPCSARV